MSDSINEQGCETEAIKVCRRATEHNYGECVLRWESDNGALRVWLSSWPRMQEAKRALVAAGYELSDDGEGNVSLLLLSGPSVVAPPAQDEQRWKYCGDESPHAPHLNCDGTRGVSAVPAAPSVSTDHTDEKFRAETVTSAYLAERLRTDNGYLCLYCARRGSALWVGPGDVRQWVCEVHLNSTGPRFGAVARRG